MAFELNINNIDNVKKMIIEGIKKMVNADEIKINDIFYYSGLKKWTVKISYSSQNGTYNGMLDMDDHGRILRYQEKEV